MVVYICQCYSLNSSHPLLPPLRPESVLYVCISIPALQIGSSVPFFYIPYMCINMWNSFFSFWLTLYNTYLYQIFTLLLIFLSTLVKSHEEFPWLLIRLCTLSYILALDFQVFSSLVQSVHWLARSFIGVLHIVERWSPSWLYMLQNPFPTLTFLFTFFFFFGSM